MLHLRRVVSLVSGLESFRGLSGVVSDEFDVLVESQDGQPGQFGGGGDEHAGDGRRAVLALTGEQQLDLDRAVLGRGVRYSTGIAESGGCESMDRAAFPLRAE